jgi:mannose-1-phosphate guanylyltransferase
VQDFLGQGTFLVISGDALTDLDLGALWSHHREAGGIGTLSLKRVQDPSQLGVVILGPDGRVQGFQEKPDPAEALSNLASCGIYVFEPEIFDYFPDHDFVDWATEVFPTVLEQDVPLYGHEIDGYWNDIGSIVEFRRGNFDALTGQVEVEVERLEIEDGLWAASSATLEGEVLMQPPVYVGEGSRVGADTRLTGPVVIGDNCTIGAGASLGDVVVWPGAEVPPGAVEVGGVTGTKPLAARLPRRY